MDIKPGSVAIVLKNTFTASKCRHCDDCASTYIIGELTVVTSCGYGSASTIPFDDRYKRVSQMFELTDLTPMFLLFSPFETTDTSLYSV